MKYPWQKREKQRKTENKKIYNILRKDYLRDNTRCKAGIVGCTGVATEIHHKKGRLGELLTLIGFWLPVCRNCHTWIETHPIEAKKLGLSISRLKC